MKLIVTIILSALSSLSAQNHEPVSLDFEFIDVYGTLGDLQDNIDFVELELEGMFEPVSDGFGEISVPADWQLAHLRGEDPETQEQELDLFPVTILGPVVDGMVTLPAGEIIHLLSPILSDDEAGNTADVIIHDATGTVIYNSVVPHLGNSLARALAARVGTMRINTNPELMDRGFPQDWAVLFGFEEENFRSFPFGINDTFKHEVFHTLGYDELMDPLLNNGRYTDPDDEGVEQLESVIMTQDGLRALLGDTPELENFITARGLSDAGGHHLTNHLSVSGESDFQLWFGDPETWEDIPIEDRDFRRMRNLLMQGYPAGRDGMKRIDYKVLEEITAKANTPIRVKPSVLAAAQNPPPPVAKSILKNLYTGVNAVYEYLRPVMSGGLPVPQYKIMKSVYGIESERTDHTGLLRETKAMRKAFAEAYDLWKYNNKPGISVSEVRSNYLAYREWREDNPTGNPPASIFNNSNSGNGDTGSLDPQQPGNSIYQDVEHYTSTYTYEEILALAYGNDQTALSVLRHLDENGSIILKGQAYLWVYHSGLIPETSPSPISQETQDALLEAWLESQSAVGPEVLEVRSIHAASLSNGFYGQDSPWYRADILSSVLDEFNQSYVCNSEDFEWGCLDHVRELNALLDAAGRSSEVYDDIDYNGIPDIFQDIDGDGLPDFLPGTGNLPPEGYWSPPFKRPRIIQQILGWLLPRRAAPGEDAPKWGLAPLEISALENGDSGYYWRIGIGDGGFATDGLVFPDEFGVSSVYLGYADGTGGYLSDFSQTFVDGYTHIDFPGEPTQKVTEIYLYPEDGLIDLPTPMFKEEYLLIAIHGADNALPVLGTFLNGGLGGEDVPLPRIPGSTAVDPGDIGRLATWRIINPAPGTRGIDGLYLHMHGGGLVTVEIDHAGTTTRLQDIPPEAAHDGAFIGFGSTYKGVTEIRVNNGLMSYGVLLIHPRSIKGLPVPLSPITPSL